MILSKSLSPAEELALAAPDVGKRNAIDFWLTLCYALQVEAVAAAPCGNSFAVGVEGMAMAQAIANFFSSIHQNPEAFAKLTSIFIFAVSFVFLIFCWLFSDASLEVPLILLGVATIAVLVLLSQQQIVILASVLIVGTIVTKEDFLLKVAALVSDHAADVPKEFYTSDTVDKSELVALIRKEISSKSTGGDVTPEAAATAVEVVLTKARVAELSKEVIRAGADIPLGRLVEGTDSWQDLVANFKDKDFFRDDVKTLRDLNLVDCEGDDFSTCKATEVGRKVAEASRTGGLLLSEDELTAPIATTDDSKTESEADTPKPDSSATDAPAAKPEAQ